MNKPKRKTNFGKLVKKLSSDRDQIEFLQVYWIIAFFNKFFIINYLGQ